MRGHILNLDVFNPRSSETHELCFLRSQHTDLYGFIPCAANALSIKPLSSSFLIRRASLSSSRFTAPIFGFCAFIKRCTWTMLSTDGSGLRSKTRNKVKIAFFGPRGIDFHAPHQCFDRRRLVLGCHDVGYRFDFSLEQVLQCVAALLQKTSLHHQSLAEELMLEIGVFADNRESLGFDSATS